MTILRRAFLLLAAMYLSLHVAEAALERGPQPLASPSFVPVVLP